MITEELLIKESGQYDPEIIQRLKLMHLGLKRIASLEKCTSLIELNLSRNEIGSIAGLDSLISLQRLDLSYNRIRKIENMMNLGSLEFLDLKGNHISSVNDLMELQTLSQLKSLFLKGADGSDANPACQHPSYIPIVMRTLPQLEIIDGGHLQISEAFQSLDEHLKDIQPDPDACKTPPLEPWLDGAEMKAALAIGEDSIEIDNFLKSSRIYKDILSSHDQVQDMLGEECSHLLRKSQTSISKASKS